MQQPIMPPGLTIAEQVKWKKHQAINLMRFEQFEDDHMAMMRSLDPAEFKKLILRWGGQHPPDWNDTETIIRSIHMRRVVTKALEMEERMKSARYLLSVNIKLPPMVILQGDAMTGRLVDVG